jgi:hypothetical protein
VKEPSKVRLVARMRRDVEVLSAMFGASVPTRRLVRGKQVARVLYGFGDASGSGFGASWTEPVDSRNEDTEERRIRYRFGRWGSDVEGASSNYRELKNLVDVLEEMGEKGELQGIEVFLFTDNSTAEAAFARGSSSSKSLFLLVKRIKLLEMTKRTRVHVIHVSGKRMIVQGTDGLSRGMLSEGVMGGDDMTSFVPLHKTALERSEGLLAWLKSHCDAPGKQEFECLSVEQWFEKGHDVIGADTNVDGVYVPRIAAGCYVWAPPPCVAVYCLEELRKARHKRQKSSHIFVCPRVMTTAWQRQLLRSADCVVHIPPGHPHWSHDQHEPLVIGFYFPFLKHEPWQLKGSPRVLELGGQLQRMCKDDPVSSGRLLRQLWDLTRRLPSLQEHVVLRMLQGTGNLTVSSSATRKDEGQVWRKKNDEQRFLSARKGDTLLAPFQCDLCWFLVLHKRPFNAQGSRDQLNMALIRRVNLDVFWAKETSTVHGMHRVFVQALQSAIHLGLRPGFLQERSVWPMEDKVGFGEAMLILWRSLKQGRTVEGNQQFDSVRKLRSLASGIAAARPQSGMDGISFKDKGKILSLTKSGVDSALFERFIKGCEKRMGRIVRQDMGLSVPILLTLLNNLERELHDPTTDWTRKRQVVMLGACLVIGFCDALRGNEIFLVEGSYLCQYAKKGRVHECPHVVVPLMGRFKGETGERNVLRVLVRSTKSGIHIGRWVDRLVRLLESEGRDNVSEPGPASFCDERGFVLASSQMNEWFHDELTRIQEAHSELIQKEVDVANVYNIHRSLRRGATSRASELNYTETLINLNNRWRQTQTNKGKGGLVRMSQLYVEVSLVMKNLLAFSASL